MFAAVHTKKAGTCDESCCRCKRSGFIGASCSSICERYNPCHEGAAECVTSHSSPGGYDCICDERHTGRYCEQTVNQTCPSSWWGSPVCGPCNCPKDRGFDPSCDKQTGHCNCRVRAVALRGGSRNLRKGGPISLFPSSSLPPSFPLSLPSPFGSLGERCKLPQLGPGRSPGRKRIWCTLKLSESHWWL